MVIPLRRKDRLRATVVLVVAVATSGACADGDGARVTAATRVNGSGEVTTTSSHPCLMPNPEERECGIPFDELRDLNLRHADRLEFAGDPESAYAVAVEVEERLESLLAAVESPSIEQVDQALREISEFVTVSNEAVRATGIAFAVEVDGGCIFGNMSPGTVQVEIGGFVRDGGCLPLHGH